MKLNNIILSFPTSYVQKRVHLWKVPPSISCVLIRERTYCAMNGQGQEHEQSSSVNNLIIYHPPTTQSIGRSFTSTMVFGIVHSSAACQVIYLQDRYRSVYLARYVNPKVLSGIVLYLYSRNLFKMYLERVYLMAILSL